MMLLRRLGSFTRARREWPSFAVAVLLSFLSIAPMRAQAQVKPRFVIGVDTSGSMLWDLSGNPTYGDGVGRPSTGSDPVGQVQNGVFYGCGTTAGLDLNCDGWPNDSRIAIAKDAIRKMIYGFGDVEWSLTKFRQIHALNKRCLQYNGTSSCQAQVYGNPQCNTGTVDNTGCVGNVPAACRPGQTGVTSMRRAAGSDFAACVNYGFDTDNQGNELSCLGADLLVGFTGFGAFTTQDNRPAILKWMDNVETSFSTDTTIGNFCMHSGSGDCELRAGGSTPLGALIQTSGDYATTIKNGDSSASCRQYSTIIVTDGAETCNTDPTTVAFKEAYPGQGNTCPGTVPTSTPAIRTYVVGISISATDQASLNDIARCGGTGNAYFATSASQLSAALADIVSKSIPVEVCNGKDDDCDGVIDEDLPAGQPGSAPQTDALFCDGEGVRSASQNNQVKLRPEFANVSQTTAITSRVVCGHVNDTCTHPGVDDDCDGRVDEDATNLTTCGTCPGANDVCDGKDNDCDNVIDEVAGTAKPFSACPVTCTKDVPCGSAIGECKAGVFPCVNGVLNTSTCVGEVKSKPEVCDQKDNNCNGVVDDPDTLQRTCTTPFGSVGICLPGTQLCAKAGEMADGMGYHVDSSGKPVCAGQVLPEDREKCDLLDHDCDGNPFTCTQSTCVIKPNPEHVGDACGQGVGTCAGTLVCNSTTNPPTLMCNASPGVPEICDGLDNDCDGNIDEDLGAGGPCGSSIGECKPGTFACSNDGSQKCVGNVGPVPEVCDSLDNDCDGKIDEELGLGDACGMNVGECKPGHLVCAGGQTVCSGAVGQQLETCDCLDNDCDGKVDEDTTDNPVCPSGSQCQMCQCVLPCKPSVEFSPPCPQGKAAVQNGDSCFCVGEVCKENDCAKQTLMQNDTVQCAPDKKLLRACTCKNNECTFACSGVTCGTGLVCDGLDGRCKRPSCLLPQFACKDGERCALQEGILQCVTDACAGVECAADEACRDGSCVKSCAAVSCPSNQRCVDGSCIDDPCASVTCNDVQACDPAQATCVAAGVCAFNGCDDGQVCNRLGGACSEDPCLKTRCPSAEKCNSETGQCEPRCTSGEVLCDDACINPQASREHCGASSDCAGDNAGQNCGADKVCSLGSCTSDCAGSLIACEGACIDPARDATHCGAYDDCQGDKAGQECPSGTTCVAGSCRLPTKTPTTPSGGTRVVATGGGGCACNIGPGTASSPESHRTGLLLLAFGLLALFRRRRLLPRTAAETLIVLVCAASAWLLDSGCKLNPICLDCGKDGGVQDSGITGDNPDARVNSKPDTGTGTTTQDGAVDSGGGTNTKTDASQPDAGCTGVELCNNRDDDCDGKIDEDADPAASGIDIQTNPSHCGGCGKQCMIAHAFNACVNGSCTIDTSSGNSGCDIGFYDLDHDAANGCEYRCVKTADDDTVCDQRDNDCDGKVDEDVDPDSDPQNCGSCMLRCSFVHAPNGATCSMKECVLDDTKCEDGWRNIDHRQVTGCEYRCPVWPTVDEVCNAIDDDCDGNVDEDVDMAADPRLGMACGVDTGECKAAATACVMGSPTCTGSVGPVNELCDGKDNDCDNKTDEDFTTATDIANCGSCGHACVLNSSVINGHAVLACVNGQCTVGGCVGNFADRNGDYHDGCETPCTITGNEVCDGFDNDCNGLIDDNVTAPSVVCAARQTGVCDASPDARTKLQTNGPKCTNGVLSCDPTGAGIAGFETSEVSCDTLDNDCDGKVDEIYPQVGQACTAGQGVCKATGVNVCDNNNILGYRCNATAQQVSTAEACDGLDNDCDGTVDNFPTPASGSNITGFNLVNVGSNTLMMAYEASRPDATSSNPGTQTQKPCSASGRVPWANVTWGEAEAACCALNSNGQCQAGNKGWRLCDSTTWQSACKGPGTCTWAYTAQCAHAANVSTYQNTCLGAEGSGTVTCADSTPCATTTGSSSFAQCAAVTSGGNVFDMSGNLKEWTFTSQGTNIYEQRGGSYNNLEAGRACDFNFTVGSTAFRFPTTGFRCCFYP